MFSIYMKEVPGALRKGLPYMHCLSIFLSISWQPMSYLPLSVCHWQEAVKSIFNGKVQVVDVYDDVTIRAASLEIPLPSVIALTEYVPQFQHTPAFTRRNVFLRDEYKCQYCLGSFHTADLSIDHVVPRSMGGVLQWYV
jgi:5-methylcytosine-specific restriction endonuclease McrA